MITPATEIKTPQEIPLSVPELGGNEWKYLKECLDSGWVSSAGPFVDRFEKAVAQFVGAGCAVAVSSGTAALHIALQIAGVKPGDDVLVSDLTFVAPVNAIRYCQAHPVFIDADPVTWQMDVKKLERFLSTECEVRDEVCFNKRSGRRVSVILPVHILGLSCEIDQIVGLAWRFHLKVVEDAAEAIGVRYRGKHVSTFGDLGVLSFNGNKIATAGGGGVVVTDHAPYAKRAKYLTTQAKDDEMEYLHNEVGYNYRLTNLQAAVGLAQMEQLPEFLVRKRAIADRYHEAISGSQVLAPMPRPSHTEANFWLYTVLMKEAGRNERERILQGLRQEGIQARPLWKPIHTLPPYREELAYDVGCASSLYERALSLPSSVGLNPEEQNRCIQRLFSLIS